MTLPQFLLWLAIFPHTILFVYLACEILLGLRRLPAEASRPGRADAAVLIPAHDEEMVISATVTALRAGSTGTRIVVVADNCRDRTAALARRAGAECIIRTDPLRRGKGYALAAGRDYLQADPPGSVIVLDADCRIDDDGIARLANHCRSSNGPVQATNLILGGESEGPKVAISNFAMMVKNLFRARGMVRLGGGGLLFGTGMAFPWPLFASLELATGDATEDIRMGLELVRDGQLVKLADDVHVTSPPAALDDTRGQRSRWEHGFLANMGRHAIPLIIMGITRRRRAPLAIGMHMLIPPLALLVASGLIVLAIAMLGALSLGYLAPVAVLLAAFVLAAVALMAAWAAGGSRVLPLRDLATIPHYVLWKLPIYANFLHRRQISWNRTARKSEHD